MPFSQVCFISAERMETHKARHTSQPDSCLFLCTSEGRRGTYFHTCETLGSFLALQNTERLRIKGYYYYYYYYFAWLECRAGETVIRDGFGATITSLGWQGGRACTGPLSSNSFLSSFLVGLVEIHVSAECMSQSPVALWSISSLRS